MLVAPSVFTVAEYFNQMSRDEIRVNREYQRSPKVWPNPARSYLIDTMLLGFPIPKLTLYQRTDLRTRTTVKEIVDGQQRSQAIFDYMRDGFRLGSNTSRRGRTFSQLDMEEQQLLLEYRLSTDILITATDDEIRQLFRRINSFNLPLNKQETRHALFQGEFKWFIVRLTDRYAQSLKEMGVFREQQLSRMADAELFSEIIMALDDGVETTSQPKINAFYKRKDEGFPEATEIDRRFDQTLAVLLRWRELFGTAVMKAPNFYALFLAVAHALEPVPRLADVLPADGPVEIDDEVAQANLSAIAEGVENPDENDWLREFIDAQAAGTNVAAKRLTRTTWFYRALQLPILP